MDPLFNHCGDMFTVPDPDEIIKEVQNLPRCDSTDHYGYVYDMHCYMPVNSAGKFIQNLTTTTTTTTTITDISMTPMARFDDTFAQLNDPQCKASSTLIMEQTRISANINEDQSHSTLLNSSSNAALNLPDHVFALFDFYKTLSSRPDITYVCLITMAIECNEEKMATLSEIYSFFEHFSYYANKRDTKWKNSIRHCLSFNDNFQKIDRNFENRQHCIRQGQGSFWTLHPHAPTSLILLNCKYPKRTMKKNILDSSQ